MIKICQGLTTLFLLIFCTFNVLYAQNPESTAAVRPLFTGPATLHITGHAGIVNPLISLDRDGTHRISKQATPLECLRELTCKKDQKLGSHWKLYPLSSQRMAQVR